MDIKKLVQIQKVLIECAKSGMECSSDAQIWGQMRDILGGNTKTWDALPHAKGEAASDLIELTRDMEVE